MPLTPRIWIAGAAASAGAVAWIGGGSPLHAVAALAIVYAAGYVTGALLVSPDQDRGSLALGTIRLVSGLLLTTTLFLGSLLVSLPWFTGPVAACLLAITLYRRDALTPPSVMLTWRWSTAAAVLFGAILLVPTLIASVLMAPGEFPPVFFNVDTPYFLEKVHTLVTATSYPPDSLGVLGGRRPYHFGVHGLTALITRGSGLLPHHSLFLVVLPILTASVLAAAMVLARCLSPALPLWATSSLLLVSVPTLWYPYWKEAGSLVREAMTQGTIEPLAALFRNVELWGVASNNGQNIASHFIILASLAGMASASTAGWRLPVFLIGSAVIFKAPTGVALASGFCVAMFVMAVTTRGIRPLFPAVGVALVFGIVYGAFWVVPPIPPEFAADLFPFFHLDFVRRQTGIPWFLADVAWLVLPALIVLPWGVGASWRQSLALIAFAFAPFVVVNTLRSIDLRPGFGVDDDWLQIMLPVPLVLHALVLSVVGGAWPRIGTAVRATVIAAMALMIVPPAVAAAGYSLLLIEHPEQGHEFVDNRPAGEALAVIPVQHTLLVTNDLRYPAEGFSRDNRQMQIPALFGHQGFSLNYAYESYSFSRDRLVFQKLLQGPEWSATLDEAAGTYGWTHLLIRKDYPHPASIPLERIFMNEQYEVYRFR